MTDFQDAKHFMSNNLLAEDEGRAWLVMIKVT